MSNANGKITEHEVALPECKCGACLTGLPNVGLIHGVDCPLLKP
jgi:hypothetical protein